MRKINLIKNPELFQGEKYLNKNNNYFEGWYFKNTHINKAISFIPGINIDEKDKKAFIQIITNDKSYFINYNIDEFKFNFNPFYIKIRDNYFSKNNIHVDITENSQNLKIIGDIKYINSKNIDINNLSPNIMGPFAYIPFMECNHAILSMKSTAIGKIKINNNIIDFNNGTGYIEKDWGCSFPKSYIWCQGNNFKNSDTSFMMAIANIPLKLFEFRGIICDLIINNKEFKFATYNNTKLVNYIVNDKLLDITLKKGEYFLNVSCKYDKGSKLIAPIKGRMQKDIYESISSNIFVTLKKKNKIIFCDTSFNCGIEIVKD